MAGRPRNTFFIVPQLAPEFPANINMKEIHAITASNEDTLTFFAAHGLIHNSMDCVRCEVPMVYSNRANAADGKCWYCKTCKCRKSVKTDSFFANSNIALSTHLEIVYWWSLDVKQSIVISETGVSRTTLVDWYNFYRDVCCQYFIDHPVQLGGPGEVVEIDESKFFQRKYHRGVPGPGHWVLGMVQRNSTAACMVKVPNRSAATMLPIIAHHVLPGTRILTDCWAAYNQLPGHETVNHTLHFVDPNDPTLHTNTVEGSWGNCKTKFRAMHGTSDELFESYLQDFLFRRLYKDTHFASFMFWVQHYYPC
jgi:hypothetical protein